MSKPNFVNNWIAGASDTRSLRRRLMAVLRMSSMAMGPSRKRLGLGSLGVAGASLVAAMSFAPAIAQQLPSDADGNISIGGINQIGSSGPLEGHNIIMIGDRNVLEGDYSIGIGHGNSGAPGVAAFIEGVGFVTLQDVEKNIADGTWVSDINSTIMGIPMGDVFDANGNFLFTGSVLADMDYSDPSNPIDEVTGRYRTGYASVALGYGNHVSGKHGVGIGSWNLVAGDDSASIGVKNIADGDRSSVLGNLNRVLGNDSIAVGGSNVVTAHNSYAFGNKNEVRGGGSIATGHDNTISARSYDTVAQGAGNKVDGDRNVVSGVWNTTSGNRLTAIGMQNNVSGYRGTALGQNNVVTSESGLALGTSNHSEGRYSVTIGDASWALADGSIAIGRNAAAFGGARDAIAMGAGARASNAGDVALGSGAVTAQAIGTSGATINGTNYSFAGTGPTSTVSIGNVGFERTITNIAAGRVSGTSTDGVNGSQLHATNLALADLNDGAVKYDRNPDGSVNKDSITLDGTVSTDGGATGGTKITNLAQGAVNNGSTEAINGTQLFGVSQSIVNHLGGGTVNPDGSITGPTYVIQGNNATTIKQAFEEVDDSLTTINNSLTNITNGGGIKYFHANSTKADSVANGTDSVAVGPEAVANGDRSVAMGAGAKADHADSVALGSGSVTGEAKGTSGTTINGDDYDFAGTNPKGTVSVGDKDSERTITNVAAGEVSETSTDAVNGSQLHATNQAVEKLGDRVTVVEGDIVDIKGDITNIQGDITNIQDGVEGAVKYDRNPDGTVNKESITLEGKDGTKITNLQDGEVSKDSTDAVNGSQLHETNEKIADLDDSAVKYKKNPDGSKSNEVALEGGDPNAPVLISNVADGKVEKGSTEAVNGGQLYQVKTEGKNYTDQKFTEANSYTDQKFTEANNYTDNKFNQLSSEIGDVRKEARQAAAVGLAAASLRFDDRPGKLSAAVGGGYWRSEGALALGMGYTSEDGRIRSNISATTSGGHWGAGAGLSYTFN